MSVRRTRLLQVAAAATSAVLFTRYRRWHLRWGATDEELAAAMPGDELLPRAAFIATRGTTIRASPNEVWPWLVQVGFGRAGFYSYDLLDNLARPSVRHVLPQFQAPEVGDIAAPMTQPATEATAFRVAQIEPPHRLVWAKPDSTWAWQLTPTESGGTRLLTRLKAQYPLNAFLPVSLLLMEIADFPMMRKMLIGIRTRAERSPI
jgi:hypothetical protein